MEEKLLAYFTRFQPLTEEEQQAILKGVSIREVPKGTFLLREGEIASENYFVLKGCVRQYFMAEGEEKTSHFFTEEEWIMPVLFDRDQGTSHTYLICMEDCILLFGNDQEGNNLIGQYPNIQKVSQQILEQEITRQQAELAKYVRQSPEQR
ncbi:MAG: Crp/Fnr family transcriptional regulator, partial [Bacteroidota bacterium]